METFSALLARWEGNASVTGRFSSQRPVAQNFDIFFDLRLSNWLSNQHTGDTRRHHTHYAVIIMYVLFLSWVSYEILIDPCCPFNRMIAQVSVKEHCEKYGWNQPVPDHGHTKIMRTVCIYWGCTLFFFDDNCAKCRSCRIWKCCCPLNPYRDIFDTVLSIY